MGTTIVEGIKQLTMISGSGRWGSSGAAISSSPKARPRRTVECSSLSSRPSPPNTSCAYRGSAWCKRMHAEVRTGNKTQPRGGSAAMLLNQHCRTHQRSRERAWHVGLRVAVLHRPANVTTKTLRALKKRRQQKSHKRSTKQVLDLRCVHLRDSLPSPHGGAGPGGRPEAIRGPHRSKTCKDLLDEQPWASAVLRLQWPTPPKGDTRVESDGPRTPVRRRRLLSGPLIRHPAPPRRRARQARQAHASRG